MTRNRIRDSLSFFLFSGIAFAIFISALLFSEAATAKVPRSMTASQIVLKAVMQDIRTCDKATPYAYDTKTKTLTPVALHRIKGLKLKRKIKKRQREKKHLKTYRVLFLLLKFVQARVWHLPPPGGRCL